MCSRVRARARVRACVRACVHAEHARRACAYARMHAEHTEHAEHSTRSTWINTSQANTAWSNTKFTLLCCWIALVFSSTIWSHDWSSLSRPYIETCRACRAVPACSARVRALPCLAVPCRDLRTLRLCECAWLCALFVLSMCACVLCVCALRASARALRV